MKELFFLEIMDLMMAKLFDVKSGGTTTTVADTETEQLINELTKATFTAAAEAAAIKSTTASPPIDPDDICGHTSMYNPVVIGKHLAALGGQFIEKSRGKDHS